MQDEELFVGGYVICRIDEDTFSIEQTATADVVYISERQLAIHLSKLVQKIEA